MTLDEGMIRVDPETGEVLDGLDISGEELAHYGMPRRSGPYPWGPRENPDTTTWSRKG